VARTRRSSAARSAPGSTSGIRPPGSTSGSRARVSASMPLLLACRDKNRRRSADFCEDTRNTVCPRAVKNTAAGSHAGPVGSITTSSLVPSGQPASAAASAAERLSTVGQALRLATIVPSPSSTRTVCAVAMPKSMPTRRRWLIPPPSPRMPDQTGSPARAAQHQATVPSSHGQPRLPLMCCNQAQPRRAGLLPSSGASVARPGVAIRRTRPSLTGLPQTLSQRHPPDQPGMTMQPLGTSAPRWIHESRCPLHDPDRAHSRAAKSEARNRRASGSRPGVRRRFAGHLVPDCRSALWGGRVGS
jgi:hypothetical protein